MFYVWEVEEVIVCAMEKCKFNQQTTEFNFEQKKLYPIITLVGVNEATRVAAFCLQLLESTMKEKKENKQTVSFFVFKQCVAVIRWLMFQLNDIYVCQKHVNILKTLDKPSIKLCIH